MKNQRRDVIFSCKTTKITPSNNVSIRGTIGTNAIISPLEKFNIFLVSFNLRFNNDRSFINCMAFLDNPEDIIKEIIPGREVVAIGQLQAKTREHNGHVSTTFRIKAAKIFDANYSQITFLYDKTL